MAVYLSSSELNRIKKLCSKKGPARSVTKKEKAKTLAAKSESRSKNWPNTLDNSRAQKLRKRQERLDELERQQRILDKEEEKLRKQERQQMIDRANQYIYAQNDGVKQFNSQMLLAEVMQEQAQAVKLKEERARKEKQRDKMYHKISMEGAKKLKEREDKEALIRAEKAKEFALAQKKQLAEVHERERRRMEEDAEEGRKAVALAKKVLKEAQDAQVRKKKEIADKNKERDRDNVRLAAYKEQLKKREREELKKIELYAKKKLEIEEKRKTDFAAKQRAKHEARQKMIDDQTRRLEEIKAKQKEIELVQNNDSEKKRQEELRMKEAKRQKLMEDIHRSRQQQLQYKQRRREAELKHDKALAKHTRERLKELVALEKEERMANLKKNKEHQDFLRTQAKERNEKRIAECKAVLAEDRERIKAEADESNRLAIHVESLKNKIEAKGYSAKPLTRLAQKLNVSHTQKQDAVSSWTGPL